MARTAISIYNGLNNPAILITFKIAYLEDDSILNRTDLFYSFD